MTRPKYKDLYHNALNDCTVLQDRLDTVTRHLKRLQAVIIPHGERIRDSIPREGTEPITLSPLDYEAVSETFTALQRYISDEPVGPPSLMLRARRLLRGE